MVRLRTALTFGSVLFLILASFWQIHMNERVGFLFAMSLASIQLTTALIYLGEDIKNEIV